MPQEVFTYPEAKDLQGHQLRATQNFKDEHGRTLIPRRGVCRVIGLDAWGKYEAGIAVQYDGHSTRLPKVVLMNKTTYQENFKDVSV
jgi:hypothetical protein